MTRRKAPTRTSRRGAKKRLGGIAVACLPAIAKERFARDEAPLRTELLAAQYELRDSDRAMIVLLAGPDREAILEFTHRLSEWFDARHVDLVARAETTEEEREHPYFWRFATRLPAAGRIAVVPFGWAQDALLARIDPKLAKSRGAAAASDVVAFERQFTDAGHLLVKFWFHRTDSELRARARAERDDPTAPWDPDKTAAKRASRLAKSDAAESALLRATNHDAGTWAILHAEDDDARDLAAGRMLRDRMRAFLAAPPKPRRVPVSRVRIVDRLAAPPSPRSVADDEYEDRFRDALGELNIAARKAYRHGRPTILVFEGGDAAGKGGAIRRVTKGIRAPVFDVIPISAPNDEERARHWLWRFWRTLPRDGRVTIFDRSWYGRVLVERVEGFAHEDDWRRAYGEIRDFERWLVDHGTTLVKFWLEVSPDEQERRFAARGSVPFKKYKLTPDDFRNRAKRPQYALAANEMFARTSTPHAPWIVLDSDDKKATRLEIVRRVAAAMKRT